MDRIIQMTNIQLKIINLLNIDIDKYLIQSNYENEISLLYLTLKENIIITKELIQLTDNLTKIDIINRKFIAD